MFWVRHVFRSWKIAFAMSHAYSLRSLGVLPSAFPTAGLGPSNNMVASLVGHAPFTPPGIVPGTHQYPLHLHNPFGIMPNTASQPGTLPFPTMTPAHGMHLQGGMPTGATFTSPISPFQGARLVPPEQGTLPTSLAGISLGNAATPLPAAADSAPAPPSVPVPPSGDAATAGDVFGLGDIPEDASPFVKLLAHHVISLTHENRSLKQAVIALQHKPSSTDAFFSSSEITGLMTDLEPAEITTWINVFAAAVLHRNETAYAILFLADEQWAAASADPLVATANSWLARALLACLNKKAPHVTNFMNLLAESPHVMLCGRSIFTAIRSFPSFLVGPEQDTFVDILDKKTYFKSGMSLVDAKNAASQLKKDFELLPAEAKHSKPNALLYKLIDKMPTNLAKVAKDLKADLWKSQTFGLAPPSFEQLSALVSVHISDGNSYETNAARFNSKCVVCASATCPGKTDYHKCPVAAAGCETCKLNFCPGCQPGKECAVAAAAVPTAAIKNGNDKPLFPTLLAKLVAAHEKYHAGPSTNSANISIPSIASTADAFGPVVASANWPTPTEGTTMVIHS